MVVTQEVQEAVQRQMRHLAPERAARRAGLPPRRVEGDVDLPEEDAPGRIRETGRVGQWKGEHVGRPVHLAVVAIEGPDLLVAGQDEGDGGAGAAEHAQRADQDRLKNGRP